MPLWQLAFIGYLIFTTWSALQNKSFIDKSQLHPLVSVLVRTALFGLPSSIVYALATDGIYMPSLPVLALSAFESAIGVTYGYVSFYAIKHTQAGVFATVIKLHTVLVVLAGGLLLGESLVGWQWAGAGLLIVSSLLLGKRQLPRRSYAWLGLSCVLLAAMVLLSRVLIKQTDVGTTLLFSAIFGLLIRLPIVWSKALDQRAQIRRELKAMLKLSLLARPQLIFVYLAVDLSGNVSLISALGSIKVVLVSLGAALLLQERDNLPLGFTAAATAMLGALFMAR